ncbi:sugar-transfer associated ATP-grasp domain-containing protein [Peristeroidobacter agariperforans]|uniref:sugar-transfer associated ATP-grasp domain-containing protein n=1 Tax=Peristeroidobacter agariperforans TaxID=268404 RepID=UPI00101BEB84|nr:sugar-transfer associated ATP-grasp domain-containing protein [Peristeroidobacter agariperforans]
MSRIITAQLKRATKAGSFLSVASSVASSYGISFPNALRRVLWAFNEGRFDPGEALVNGVLDPKLPLGEARKFVSKRELIKLQEEVNPRHWYYTTEDKGIFYRFCEEADIRVPTVHAILFRGRQSWAKDGTALLSTADIGKFLETQVPERVIIKPTRGVHGQSVWAINRNGDGSFSSSSGKNWRNGQELATAVLADAQFNAFVVQDRVTSHPVLRALTGSEALQSSRVVTYVDRHGEVHFIAASIRLISGAAIIDNIDWGRTGNFALQLHPDSGRPMDAMTFAHGGRVMCWIRPEDHPKLGPAIKDFQVPEWDAVRALLTRGARKFLPLRTLGWDVAITPEGPMVVEANFRWDPMMHPCMRSAVETIRKDYGSDSQGV